MEVIRIVLKRDLIGFVPNCVAGWSGTDSHSVVQLWKLDKTIYAYTITSIESGAQVSGWIDVLSDFQDDTNFRSVIYDYLMKHHNISIAYQ
jgi:hypothetical protein